MLNRIEAQIPSLSRAEQRVARWLLAHPRQAANATLAEMAAECDTSEPTVIRFCRHVGLDGFRDLARRLTEALSQPASYVHRSVGKDDTTADAVSKVVDASIQALIEVRSRLPLMPVDEAVSAMSVARQIAFAGLGASGHVAADACHKFFRLGIPCSALGDSPTILQFASIATADDVLVTISHAGHWPALHEAAEMARARGATVIGLTDPQSDLASSVKLLFACPISEDTSVYTPMSSRLVQLTLLDALHVALALSLKEVAADNLRRSKYVLMARRSKTAC